MIRVEVMSKKGNYLLENILYRVYIYLYIQNVKNVKNKFKCTIYECLCYNQIVRN